MSYNIFTTVNFKKEYKRLLKKYPSLKNEIAELGYDLSRNPIQGKHLGNNVYKIRLKIKSKGKGKRGGARVITKVKIVEEMVFLFSIYSKGEKRIFPIMKSGTYSKIFHNRKTNQLSKFR